MKAVIAAGKPRRPVEDSLVRLWHLPLLFLLIPLGALLGQIAGNVHFSLLERSIAAFIAWLILLGALGLAIPWLNRLDEFQQKIVWQGAGMAGFLALSHVVGFGLYLAVSEQSGALAPLLGSAPGVGAWAAALMIWGLERRARRVTRGARE